MYKLLLRTSLSLLIITLEKRKGTYHASDETVVHSEYFNIIEGI